MDSSSSPYQMLYVYLSLFPFILVLNLPSLFPSSPSTLPLPFPLSASLFSLYLSYLALSLTEGSVRSTCVPLECLRCDIIPSPEVSGNHKADEGKAFTLHITLSFKSDHYSILA